MSMMPPQEPKPKGFSAQDFATIISGITQGATTGMGAASQAAQSRKEAKELKRQTYSDILNRILGRSFGLKRAQTKYGDEAADFQSDALQQIARGFIDSLRGG